MTMHYANIKVHTVASYQSSSCDEIVMIVVKFDNNKNIKMM